LPARRRDLTLHSRRVDDAQIISLVGELDYAGAPAVARELDRIEKTDVRRITLDLSGLTFMDSSGLRLLLLANLRSRADGHRLGLRAPPHFVRRVLALTGAAKQMTFEESHENAPAG
jgi:anti-anti-sigma factor